MKTQYPLPVAALISALAAATAQAQFNAGSDGSYGPLLVTNTAAATTLQLPPDGIFRCTTITIAQGATLNFIPNALNTPVYLLATSNVTISGTIDVTGKGGTSNPPFGGLGGPGGFEGGNPGIDTSSIPPGSGRGPGAGRGGTGDTNPTGAGAGGFAQTGINGSTTNHGKTYGNPLLIPIVGGSGGGGTTGNAGNGGGGGGGAILIASNTRIDVNSSGHIWAYGGTGGGGSYNGGSGGAIRLVAPIVAGNGELNVVGQSGGGYGRIRVDTLNRLQTALNYQPFLATTIGGVMSVFPAPLPRLDIISTAGTSIAEGTNAQVVITLPFGSDTNRTVVVQARDFQGVVPISVVLTPDNGTPATFNGSIDMATGNPATATVNVTFPVNVRTTVNAWTR